MKETNEQGSEAAVNLLGLSSLRLRLADGSKGIKPVEEYVGSLTLIQEV